MGQIQKRYLYAGLLSGAFFIVVYGILNFHLLLSLILTCLMYVGGVFFYKEKDIRTLTPEYIDNYYYMASKCAAKAGRTDDVTLKERVEEITTYTDEILVSLTQRPKKVEQVFDFFDYYLDITDKILTKYNLLALKDNLSFKEQVFMNNTINYLDKIKEMFNKQLANMKEARIIDIESEIRLFEHTIGFKKTDIEVGENDEHK